MEEIFVSIVGTTSMGTLDPWLSHYQKWGPAPAILLYTEHTAARAENIARHAKELQLGEPQLIRISTSLDGPDGVLAAFAAIREEAAANSQRICFNADGGLNYMVAAAVIVLESCKPVFLLKTRTRALRYDTATREIEPAEYPRPLPIAKILHIQGVPDETGKGQSPLLKDCAWQRLKLPENRLEDVVINNIAFDLVWNSGTNNISVLKDMRILDQDKTERLAEIRQLCNWAADRKRHGDVFDVKTFALTDSPRVYEHLLNESARKLEAGLVEKGSAYWENLRAILKKWFDANRPAAESGLPKKPAQNDADALDDGTLVVALGPNEAPTLSALAAHRPKRVILCYQKKNRTIAPMAENLAACATELGIEQIDLTEFPVDGIYPDLFLPELREGAKVEVNITPGTKSQTIGLVDWALRHGCSIWSLDTAAQQSRPVHNPHGQAPYPAKGYDPLLGFRVKNLNVSEPGEDTSIYAAEDGLYYSLLDFMADVLGTDQEKALFRKDVNTGGNSLLKKSGKMWQLNYNGTSMEYSVEGGGWFEKLTGAAVLKAGVDHARVRLRTDFSEKISNANIKKYGNSHMLDLDVLAASGTRQFLISCKANPYMTRDELSKAALEARNMAQNLGRHGLPVLAWIGTAKSFTDDNGVLHIGWRDLCQPDHLRKLLEDLAASKSTTGGNNA